MLGRPICVSRVTKTKTVSRVKVFLCSLLSVKRDRIAAATLLQRIAFYENRSNEVFHIIYYSTQSNTLSVVWLVVILVYVYTSVEKWCGLFARIAGT